jgi:hypothetical protein
MIVTTSPEVVTIVKDRPGRRLDHRGGDEPGALGRPGARAGCLPNGRVYLFGPLGGALIAGLLWNHLFLVRRR